MERPRPDTRSAYPHFREITTRWMDNDPYGHVNNAVYYSYFDTAVNSFLIGNGALEITKSDVIGLVVETKCNFFRPAAFPDAIHAGLRVGQTGKSSVRYEIGLFRNAEDEACAQGHFVHVYVDRASGRPVALPEALKRAIAPLQRGEPITR